MNKIFFFLQLVLNRMALKLEITHVYVVFDALSNEHMHDSFHSICRARECFYRIFFLYAPQSRLISYRVKDNFLLYKNMYGYGGLPFSVRPQSCGRTQTDRQTGGFQYLDSHLR